MNATSQAVETPIRIIFLISVVNNWSLEYHGLKNIDYHQSLVTESKVIEIWV